MVALSDALVLMHPFDDQSLEVFETKAKVMRSFLLSAVAVTTVLASAAIVMSSDTNAATRHPRHRVYAMPYVSQAPAAAFNTFHAPGVGVYTPRGEVNPISGTPRWHGEGGPGS